ncbi:MAG: class I SAM-dependent methyltransferase [Candidatus Methanoperedens sp.]|nr:class I SAM-dependent methyltransferase [Candidatus Methanoperedens sp.]
MKYEWAFDETKQIGIDYTDIKQVQSYDSSMQKLRDIKNENEGILKDINISKDHTIVEFGTGTGEFALEAAKYCSKVIAVDISKEMLRYAEMKAKSRNIKNIEFCNGGFLTYEHKAGNIDSIISQLALHHLTDFWKIIALKRIYSRS